jgi:hypothetical protein
MEILLLLLLMLTAGLLFLPEFLKERVLDSPVNTVTDFRRGMAALAVSTHNYGGGHYTYSSGDPEPYVRRSHYTEQIDDSEDFIPYPSTRARHEMVTRRNRVLAMLLVVVLATGIMALVPSLKWIIPLHIILLVILAGYIALAILMPHAERRR